MNEDQKQSIEGLEYCLEQESGWHEDALGHIGDLFVSVLAQVNASLIKQGSRVFTLEGAFRHYVVEADRHKVLPKEIPSI